MNRIKIKLLKFAYIIYLALPAALVLYSSAGRPWNLIVGDTLGILGLSMLALQLLLASRSKLLERGVGLDRIMHWHELNAKAALTILILHPLFAAFPYFKNYTLYHWTGIIALVSLVTTVIIAIYADRLKIKYEIWRTLHRAVYVIIALGFIHSFFLGPQIYLKTPLYYWWLFILGIVTISLVQRSFLRKKLLYKVIKVKRETANAVSVYLKPRVPSQKITNLPGQFAFVTFKSKSLPKEEHHFTLSSAPSEKYLRFTIKALGDFTSLISRLKKGDKAELEGPFGAFTNANEKGPFLFIAGGAGITPIMSMLTEMSLAKRSEETLLLYANKTSSDIIFKDKIDRLAKESWLKVDYVLSEKNQRIDKKMIKNTLKILNKPLIFICGPLPLISSVKQILKELKVNSSKIHTEKFSLK